MCSLFDSRWITALLKAVCCFGGVLGERRACEEDCAGQEEGARQGEGTSSFFFLHPLGFGFFDSRSLACMTLRLSQKEESDEDEPSAEESAESSAEESEEDTKKPAKKKAKTSKTKAKVRPGMLMRG